MQGVAGVRGGNVTVARQYKRVLPLHALPAHPVEHWFTVPQYRAELLETGIYSICQV